MANYQNEITKFYQNILGRTPDPGGLKFYTDYAKGGGNLETIRSTIYNSPEAQGRRQAATTRAVETAVKSQIGDLTTSFGGLTASFEEAIRDQREQMAKFQKAQEERMREFQQQTVAAQARSAAPQQTAQVLGANTNASGLRRAGSGNKFTRPELQIKSVNI